MTTTITPEAIGARAYDLLEVGRTYTAADLAANRREAHRQLVAETGAPQYPTTVTVHDLAENQDPEVAQALHTYEAARVLYSEARYMRLPNPMIDEARKAMFDAQQAWLALRDAKATR